MLKVIILYDSKKLALASPHEPLKLEYHTWFKELPQPKGKCVKVILEFPDALTAAFKTSSAAATTSTATLPPGTTAAIRYMQIGADISMIL